MNSNMIYRTIIVDDEPPALAKLSYLLKDYKKPFFEWSDYIQRLQKF